MASLTNLQKAKGKLLIQHVFVATLVMSTPLVADPTTRTAATDMLKIIYNPAFLDGLTINQIMFVLAHEVLHIMFKHGLRRQGRNHHMWNIACDYAINLILHESGFEVIQGCLFDPRFKGMSAEQIYEILQKEKEEQEKEKGKDNPQEGQPGDQPGQGGGGGKPSFEDKHKDTGLGDDVREPENMDAETRAKVEQQVQQKVAQAANMARMAGKMPAGLARIVDEILNPSIPWQELLAEYMTRVVQDDESWCKRNRRFSDVYLPARHSTRMGEIVVIADTSGSITAKEINQVVSEVNVIAEVIKPELIRVVYADAQVAGEETFEPGDVIVCHPKGGGGTDMRVPLKHVEQYDAQVVVLITDGWTPWPTTEPPFPLITCCTTKADVPIGEVVRI